MGDTETAGAEETTDTTNQEEPLADDGASDETEAGVEDLEPADDATSPEMDSETPSEDENPLKSIQKLTGKISQKMRDFAELESKDVKYVLNSVASAGKNKLTDEDKTEIISNLEKGDEDESIEEVLVEIDQELNNFFSDRFVGYIISKANLTKESENIPEVIAYDFFDAAHIFMNNFSQLEDNPRYASLFEKLEELKEENSYSPGIKLNGVDDLEKFGKRIYYTFVKYINEK